MADDLSRHISALRRLPSAEFEVLSLRAGKRSVEEIATRLGIEAREALARLALLYDSLWLTHLSRARRRSELEQYFAALEALGADDAARRTPETTAADLTGLVAPPRRALDAVAEDEDEFAAVAAPLQSAAALPAAQHNPVIELAVTMPLPEARRGFRPSHVMVLAAILVLLIVASLAVVRLGDDNSVPALAASNTPTQPTEVAVVPPTGEPSVTAAIATEPPATATATATSTSTPSPTATATATMVPSATPSPSPTPTRTPTATPTASPSPTPMPPTATTVPPTLTTPAPTAVPVPLVVFEGDWSAGLDGWELTGAWGIVGGLLEYSGGQGLAVALAPYGIEGTSYTIEAVMEPVGGRTAAAVVGFAIQDDPSGRSRVVAAPAGGAGLRTYRLEVSADEARFFVDGVLFSTTSGSDYIDPERVGLAAAGTGLRVHSFIIIE